MICKNCGREIKDEEKECPYCGHNVNKTTVSTYKLVKNFNTKTGKKVFCTQCGKQISATASFCPYCFHKNTPEQSAKTNATNNMTNTYGESKTGIGVLLCLFLGIIGLIIGLLTYPANTVERSTFIKGWVGTFVVTIVIAIILVVASTCGAMCTAYSRYY